MIPIHFMENGKPIPDGYCYIVAGNGIFLQKANSVYKSLVKVDKIEGLQTVEERVETSIPKLSRDLIRAVTAFFVAVYEKHKAEAAIILYLNKEAENWGFLVPSQKVGATSVNYTLTENSPFWLNGVWTRGNPPDGYVQFGSIHSHASMSAFHSGTDDKDEFNFDGVHITLGDFPACASSACRVIVSGKSFPCKLEDMMEDGVDSTIPLEMVDVEAKIESVWGAKPAPSLSPVVGKDFGKRWLKDEQDRQPFLTTEW